MKTLLYILIPLTLLSSSCMSITTQVGDTKVEQKMVLQKVKSNTVNIETGEIKTEYYESNKGSVLKYLFNWSVIKGVYDLIWG